MMDMTPEVVNINEADAATLAELPGIGSILAERIVDRREKEGPFETVMALTSVSGLSDKTVMAIADRVTVGTAPGSAAEEVENVQSNESAETDLPDEPAPLTAAFDHVESTTDGMAADEEPTAEIQTMDSQSDSRQEDVVAEREAAEGQPELGEEDRATRADEDLSAEIVLITSDLGEAPTTNADAEEDEPEDSVVEELVAGETAVATTVTMGPAKPTGGGAGRGCLLSMLAGLFGAIVGIVATLIILYSFNGGTLRFASADSASDLQQDLAREVVQADQARESLASELATAQAENATLNEAVSTLSAEQQTLLADIEQAQSDTAAVEQTVQDLNERITELAQAADNFVLFMDGLRDLLIEIQGLPEPVTPSPLATGTPKAGDQTAQPTSTVRPTRTPRPTATPLVTPTP